MKDIEINAGMLKEYCGHCRKKTNWRLDENFDPRCVVCGKMDFEK